VQLAAERSPGIYSYLIERYDVLDIFLYELAASIQSGSKLALYGVNFTRSKVHEMYAMSSCR
jgi:hypothetical protein